MKQDEKDTHKQQKLSPLLSRKLYLLCESTGLFPTRYIDHSVYFRQNVWQHAGVSNLIVKPPHNNS